MTPYLNNEVRYFTDMLRTLKPRENRFNSFGMIPTRTNTIKISANPSPAALNRFINVRIFKYEPAKGNVICIIKKIHWPLFLTNRFVYLTAVYLYHIPVDWYELSVSNLSTAPAHPKLPGRAENSLSFPLAGWIQIAPVINRFSCPFANSPLGVISST